MNDVLERKFNLQKRVNVFTPLRVNHPSLRMNARVNRVNSQEVWVEKWWIRSPFLKVESSFQKLIHPSIRPFRRINDVLERRFNLQKGWTKVKTYRNPLPSRTCSYYRSSGLRTCSWTGTDPSFRNPIRTCSYTRKTNFKTFKIEDFHDTILS